MSDLLFVVTHLFGIGHLTRTAALASACAARGLSVTLASGGRPLPGLRLPGVELVQLEPALRTRDASFSELLRAEGEAATPRDLERRATQLRALLGTTAPKAVVTEMYPFGRRKLRGEFEALLAAARARTPRPWLVASVRDLLVEKPPEKMAWMAEAAAAYDRVLVHGDPDLIAFPDSFPFADRLGERLTYTGYVVEPAQTGGSPPTGPEVPQGEVLVSAGGGAFGRQLLSSALQARPLSRAAALPWRLLAGHNLPAADVDALRREAPAGVVVERARPDFAACLAACRLSVSQGGYNTTAQLLQAGCRAVVVPYAEGGQSEQAERAALLAARGLLVAAPGADSDPQRLAAAVDRALAGPDPRAAAPARPNLRGAERAAEILADLAAIVPPA
jgi:predicted glycosyltransferase